MKETASVNYHEFKSVHSCDVTTNSSSDAASTVPRVRFEAGGLCNELLSHQTCEDVRNT